MGSSARQKVRAQSAKTAVNNDQGLLKAFLGGKIEGRNFRHADHVRAGFELLRHQVFSDALAAYCVALKGMARRAGNPGAYHETITVAFLSLIAERSAAGQYADFEAFIGDNPDLMDKAILERWYTPAKLLSDIARKTFVMPDGDRLWPQPARRGRARSAGRA